MEPLEGALTKLLRTADQFDGVAKIVKHSLDAKGHIFTAEVDDQTEECVIFVEPRHRKVRGVETPLMISVILGEALHNLRSALDHMVYQLVIHDGGRPDEYTEFPIFTDRKRYRSRRRGGGLYKLRGVKRSGLAFIESLQPYPRRNPTNAQRQLLILHELSRIDKHRLLHVCGMMLRQGQIAVTDERGYVEHVTIHTDKRVEGRTELVRFGVRANTGYDEVEVNFQHAFEVVLYDAPLVQGTSVLRTMHDLQKEVADIVGSADKLLFNWFLHSRRA